jgi:uncharacterized membrane protein YfcA
MIDFTLLHSAGIILLGLLIGFLSGLFGVGGGFLMTPALKIIFNIPYNIAIGSDLAAITFTSMYGMYKHYKLSHINISLGLIILAAMLPGVEIGARILVLLHTSGSIMINGKEIANLDIVLNYCYITVLITAGVIMLLEYYKWKEGTKTSYNLASYKTGYYFFKKHSKPGIHQVNIPGLLFCGLLIGTLNGMLGVGGGFIIVPLLVNFFAIPAVVVIGTSLFIICPASAFGTLTHFLKGNVNFWLVLLILSGSLIGSYIGTSLTDKLRGKKIRKYFVYIIIAGILMVFFNIFRQFGYI